MSYIRKNRDISMLLELNENYVPIREIEEKYKNNDIVILGGYYDYSVGYIGIINLAEGPLIFINEIKIPMNDPNFSIKLDRSKKPYRVIFEKSGTVISDFTYDPLEPESWDPFSGEEDDLIVGLDNVINDKSRKKQVIETYKEVFKEFDGLGLN